MDPEMNLLQGFAADCRTRGMAEISVKTYVAHARRFQDFIQAKGKEVLETDRLDVRDYVEQMRQRKNSTKSIRYHLAALSGLYEWLIFEGLTETNPAIDVRMRYMRRGKKDDECHTHKIISVEEMAKFLEAFLDPRDKAIALVFAKTGIRKGELISLDVDSIRWGDNSLLLKKTKKRSHGLVYFDDEAAYYLKRWMTLREGREGSDGKALFLSTQGERLGIGGINAMFRKAAVRAGLHDLKSDRMEDHFSPHCCRHWFTTHLLLNGMQREFVQWLRGDHDGAAYMKYYHIPPNVVRESYLAHIPQLGV